MGFGGNGDRRWVGKREEAANKREAGGGGRPSVLSTVGHAGMP